MKLAKYILQYTRSYSRYSNCIHLLHIFNHTSLRWCHSGNCHCTGSFCPLASHQGNLQTHSGSLQHEWPLCRYWISGPSRPLHVNMALESSWWLLPTFKKKIKEKFKWPLYLWRHIKQRRGCLFDAGLLYSMCVSITVPLMVESQNIILLL